MNSVVFERRLKVFSRAVKSPGRVMGMMLPRKLWTVGRGRSVGSFSTGGTPANRCFQ